MLYRNYLMWRKPGSCIPVHGLFIFSLKFLRMLLQQLQSCSHRLLLLLFCIPHRFLFPTYQQENSLPWLALQTPRYRYYIYSENYGQEYEDLIGKSYSTELTDSELERMTEECLTENPYITGIENFSCVKIEEKVTVTFSLITELGDGEVSIDV